MKGSLLEGRQKPLDIKSKILEIDTSDFSKIEYPTIFEEVRNFLG